MHHQHIRPTGDARDRRDIADKIEIEFVVERRVDGVRRTAEEERVAVRCRTHDRLGGQAASGAAAIFESNQILAAARSIERSVALTKDAFRDFISAEGLPMRLASSHVPQNV
jgi:hypothetical protein